MKTNKGFSLIEIMLALAISIIMMTSIFFTYNKIEESKKVNIVVSQINQIKEGSEFVYKMERTYQNLNNDLLIQSGVIQSGMISGQRIINPYGGFVAVVGSPGHSYNRFNINYQNVPTDACIKISAIIHPTLFTIAVGAGNDLKSEGTIKFTLDKALSYCNLNNTGYVNMVFQSIN